MPMPKDPEKRELTRQRMSEARLGKVPWNKGKKTGQIPWNKDKKGVMPVPWNKGLTKETDERLRKSVEKMGRTKRLQFQNPELCKQMGEQTKKQWQNPEFRKQMEAMWTDPDFRKSQSKNATEQNKKNWADLEFCKKMSKIRKKIWKNPKLRKHLSDIHKRRYKDPELRKLTGEKVKQAHKKDPEYRKRMSSAAKKLWRDEEFVKKQMISRNLKPNKAEKQLASILEEILPSEYKFVGNFVFVLDGKCPDFMNVNGQKKLIELYGNYFHNLERFPKGDSPSERITHFRQFGFDALVIWEKELEDRKSLTKKIKNFHYGVIDA